MASLPRFSYSVFLFLFVVLTAVPGFAAELTALRSWRAPDNTRLVLDLSAPVRYQVSPDSTPARLIVDIEDVQATGPLALPAVQPPLKSLRLEVNGKGQRLIIETAAELLPKIFQLPPNEKYSHRLVLDLYDKPTAVKPGTEMAGKSATAKAAEEKIAIATALPSTPAVPAAKEGSVKEGETPLEPAGKTDMPAAIAEQQPTSAPGKEVGPLKPLPAPENTPTPFDPKRYRNIIVAIDAGHGGEDPGAIGKQGTHEKSITLAIARALFEQLEKEPGITPVLTRDGDYFIPLQERRRLARYQHKADIFISIHADAAENRAARGASVFALSLKGAGSATSRFARMLAERENRADLIGGVAVENEDDTLRSVLADMVVAGSLEHSLYMGRNILRGLGQVGTLHSQRVEQAGFAVLKEPGMVSLLVETGFISNPDEEKRLTSKTYQRQLADAVADGVRQYCKLYPAPGTYFAWLSEKDRAPRVAETAAGTDAKATEKKHGPPAPVLVSTRATKPTVAPKPVRHKVRGGDNLTRLAARYGVTLQQLREVNRLRDDNVTIGQVLIIPAQ